jgi:hypothetical protein
MSKATRSFGNGEPVFASVGTTTLHLQLQPKDGIHFRDQQGSLINEPITVEIECGIMPDPIPTDVAERVGPNVADMLRDQFSRQVAIQLIAASIR